MDMKKIKYLFFIRNLTRLLIPMFIPILLLGLLVIFLIQSYIKEEIEEKNMDLLRLFQSNIELIFNEIDSIHLNIGASAVEFIDLQNILQKKWLEPADYKKLASLKNYIDSPTIARPYIDSIYIYIENDQNRFLTSTTGGVVELSNFYDTSWYQGYIDYEGDKPIWTEKREIRKNLGEFNPQMIESITMYHKISLANGDKGVIVLNLNAKYLSKELEKLSQIEGQNYWMIDKNYKIIFENQSVQFNLSDSKNVLLNPNSVFSITIDNEPSIVFKLPKNKYDWVLFSSIPKSSLYIIPFRLSLITLFLLTLLIIISIIISYYLTKRNFNNLRDIIKVLDRVEKGESLPPLPSSVNDVYSYIIHGILKNFMEQSYLKIQLAERKYKTQELELAALQSQLNPHFLYNTLETINWKIIGLTKGPSELTNMIEKLADILRYSLDDNDTLTNFKEEISYSKNYIDIQKIRYKGKFDVIWEYHKNIEKYSTKRLILQPLIENSLYHGIKNSEKKCLIKIKIKLIHNNILISFIDNGIGIKQDQLELIQQNLDLDSGVFKHIGLFNTHKRLQLTFGKQYGLKVRSKLGWGTVITIRIPK